MKRGFLFVVLVLLALGARSQPRGDAPQIVRLGPASRSETAAERGREVYHRFGCAMCHGPEGKGGFANPNAATDGKVPGVTFVAEDLTERELRQRILYGTSTVSMADPKGPRPPYRMPGWRGVMTDGEANDLVEYLRSLLPQSAGEKWR